MIATIEKFTQDIKAESQQFADRAIERLRSATLQTAAFVAKGKGPVRKFADTGIKLNSISHKSVEKFVKLQAAAIEGAFDAGAKHLEQTAKADNVRTLVNGQIATLPASRDRVIGTAMDSVAIVREAGQEVTKTVRDAVGVKKAAPKKKAPAKKTAAKKAPAKKAAPKAAAASIAPVPTPKKNSTKSAA